MTVPVLSKSEFSDLQSYVHNTLGIWLPEGKMTMVEQRIRPLVIEAGFSTFGEFLEKKLRRPTAQDMTAFVNRITTNHTYFWREAEHFKLLVDRVLPEVVSVIRRVHGSKESQPELRMWCSAASRGHEPYTLAMLQREFFGSEYGRWNAGLLATDISDSALQVAANGRYGSEEIQSLSPELRRKYFSRNGDGVEVIAELKRDVLFRKFNLKKPQYSFRRPFHIVFCRNVLIYFDMPTKVEVVSKISSQLISGGYLFVGLAESLGRDIGSLTYVQPGVYKKTR